MLALWFFVTTPCTTSMGQGTWRPISRAGFSAAWQRRLRRSRSRRSGDGSDFPQTCPLALRVLVDSALVLGREGRVFGKCRGTLALASVGGHDMWQCGPSGRQCKGKPLVLMCVGHCVSSLFRPPPCLCHDEGTSRDCTYPPCCHLDSRATVSQIFDILGAGLPLATR